MFGLNITLDEHRQKLSGFSYEINIDASNLKRHSLKTKKDRSLASPIRRPGAMKGVLGNRMFYATCEICPPQDSIKILV